jgi:choline dehydrogenase
VKRRAFLQAIGAAAAVTTATRSLSARQTPEFDVVVVGAGSSGCVVASRLSADAERRVLLIEAGPARSTDPAITTPARWVSLIGSDVDWNYEAAATPGLDGRAVRWPRGRLIGGSSAINAMAYVRGHRGCYDAWAAAAGPAWSFNAVLPIFKALETNSRGPSEYLGGAGPLAVSDTTDPHAGHMAFLEAARELGFAGSPTWDFNGAQQESGAGFYQKNIRAGARHSAADAFLAPVLGRRNLTVWANTTAHRLVIERGRVIGIDVVRDGTPIRVAVSSEVVLSAGVIESPKLLMLS